MKLSAQEELGLRCLLTLAACGPGGSMTIPEIARREALSPSHVAKLMGSLRRAGVVTSVRGQAGGYRLARPAGQVSVGEVLAALGGRLYEDGFCGRYSGLEADCVHEADCRLRLLWEKVQSAVDRVVGGVTLADLAAPRPSGIELRERWPAAGARGG